MSFASIARPIAGVDRLRGHWTTFVFVLVVPLVFSSSRALGQEEKIEILPPANWDPTEMVRYAFVPNDPYYTTGNPSGFPGQWHLNVQTSGAAFDANVSPAWNRDLTGQGVVIGIVDDGLQRLQPDLAPNYDAADSWNFGNNTADPSPINSNTTATAWDGDNHGTAVAGVAAARGGNGIGVTGAAPFANLAGLRIDFPTQTDQMFIDATLYHSSGGNTNIKVKNHSYGISAPYITSAGEVGQANAIITSTGAGTIHVFAAGNERTGSGVSSDGDSNKKLLQSMQETITVAALGSNGKFASYSNWGSNVWVTAPSNTSGGFSITTTDRTGGAVATGGYNNAVGSTDNDSFPDIDYNSIFGGTSSATPLVSGIMALGKQAQPNLNVRMAKHLLVRTSRQIDLADADVHSNCLVFPACTPGWLTNGAGFKFDENYGFGLIDANAFTVMAAQTLGVTPLVTQTIGTTPIGQTIPDNNTNGISQNFLLAAGAPLEEVEVHLNVTHTWRGDLEGFLKSPSGTISRLFYRNAPDSGDNLDWTFLSNAFWGENPLGNWTLTLRDIAALDIGTWNSYSVLAKMGTLISVPEPASLMLTATGLMGVAFGFSRRRRLIFPKN
jgi:hypothetical protein